MSSIPESVRKALDGLSSSDQETVLSYISKLETQIESLGGSVGATPMEEDSAAAETSGATSEDYEAPQYDPASGQEDYEAAGDHKQKAADCKSAGNYEQALEEYNAAVLLAPPSALLYANRAIVLEKLGRYTAAAKDCDAALAANPDSAKALKVRGKLRFQHLQDWHGALSDLNQAQSIDFDPTVADILKELTALRKQEEQEQAAERIAKEEKLKKKAEDIKRAQEEAKREAAAAASAAAGGMPGMGGMGGMPGMGGMGGMPGMGGMGGMPGGMGGMPGGMDPSMMAGLMGDPEIQEAMKNPKVVAAFQELMSGPGGPMGLLSNPDKLQQVMSDPDVGPVLQKLMGKFMGGAAGGMPGGMGGMPGGMGGMGGMGGGMPGAGGGDDIPDLGEIPDLD